MLVWYSRRIPQESRIVSGMLIPIMLVTLTSAGLNGACLYILTSTGELALYSTVYRHIIYYRGRVYGHDGGYEGGNLASRLA